MLTHVVGFWGLLHYSILKVMSSQKLPMKEGS